jgi:hypothetical protein
LVEILNFSAISLIVKPSMYVISAILTQKLKKFKNLTRICLTYSNL